MEAVLTANSLKTPDKTLFSQNIQFSHVYTRHFLGERTR